MDKTQDSVSFEEFLRGMTPSAFRMLGINQLAYIKADNDNSYQLYAANGEVLATFETLNGAISATEEQELKPVTVH